ncbi:MAG: hypothetical protein CMQ46_00255 [Gammaproteobacteria bacterium]|nr:hypothetical protein [Gammaproteobacteria bacterium]MBJ53681.1 hypothetical protein [Gammaproteobacteria bacterium]HBN15736.1 hypothetical protein [Pseudohongiella sp.]
MIMLITGLVIFLTTHSASILYPSLRSRMIERMGAGGWKGVYSVLSIVSLVLIVYGYGIARQTPFWLWQPPAGLRHLALLLTLPAFILLVATYIPANRIKARIGHPMLLGVKFWALAHLLANGSLADILLFGGFLAWAVMGFVILRRRDRVNAVTYSSGTLKGDIMTIVIGIVSWAVFAMYLHVYLIGVSPMPG